MNAVVHGRTDAAGRLIEADLPLLGLHLHAGGSQSGVIAPPQLAALVRLVQRIGIAISREVIVADEDGDLDLWARAEPDGEGGVRLAIAGWTRRAVEPPLAAPARDHDFLRAGSDWTWETDSSLRLTRLSPPQPDSAPGDPLTKAFALLPDAEGVLPILQALAMQSAFEDQIAGMSDGGRVRLAGLPLRDAAGRFAGFHGSATRLADVPPPEASDDHVDADAFGKRLDAALRGPLDRIVANAETIRAQADGPLRRDYAAYATDIATAGRHLLALVGDLVDLQAIERPDFRIAPEAIDLADVARRAAGLLVVRAADRGIRIDRPAEGEQAPARGDFRRVLQILVNLIGNAVRYSPEGGLLWVRCEAGGPANGNMASIVVADQGKGLAPEDQSRIFEKFERVDPNEAGGTGLGLYISRRLARAMGGDITVDSAPGQGARFVLTLPAG